MSCRNPTLALVAFADRYPGFIFVRIPTSRGRYIRTDLSVAYVPCPICNAVVGEPCKSKQSADGYGTSTHFKRRDAYKSKFKRRDLPRIDVLEKPRIRIMEAEPCDAS